MKHPFQLVLTNKSGTHLFVSVRNNLQVFDLSNGNLVGSWVDTVEIINPLKKQQEKIKAQEEAAKRAESESSEGGEKKLKNNNKKAVRVQKSPGVIPGTVPIFNVVRSLSLSKDEKFLVGTTDSDKAAIIFLIDFSNKENCLKLIKRQTFPKRPCAVSVGDDSEFIVADKFGDVYRTTIDDKPLVDEKSLVPILGHVSMLTDVLFAELNGKKFILTADRDEHIRVTNYPVSYVIKSWLFGHHEFISAMHIPKFDPSLLISGGGDDYICLWKWYDNKLLTKIELRDLVQPFLNEAHYPPERFLTPESIFELSVTKILTHQKDGRSIIIVTCENVKCILTFELLEDYSVTHLQTLTTDHPIIDVCLNEANGQLIASIDIESNDKLLELFAFNDQLQLDTSNNQVFDTIAKEHGCEVESREDFYPLYHVNTLRKRSERVTTKQLNE